MEPGRGTVLNCQRGIAPVLLDFSGKELRKRIMAFLGEPAARDIVLIQPMLNDIFRPRQVASRRNVKNGTYDSKAIYEQRILVRPLGGEPVIKSTLHQRYLH